MRKLLFQPFRERARGLSFTHRNAVQPDHPVARRHLAVHDLAVAVTFHAACHEPEHVDEEVVRALDVLVHKERNGALDRRHCATVARARTEAG